MSRLTTAQREALKAPTIQIGILAEMDFTFGIERWWNGFHKINYLGHEWEPSGNLGKATPFNSSEFLQANGVELTLIVPFDTSLEKPKADFRNIAPAEYKRRPARLYLAFFDEPFQNVIFSQEKRFEMDQMSYSVDPKKGVLIQLNLESEILAAGKRQVKRYTDTQQRDDYPDDLGLQFLSYLASGAEIKWGQSGAFFQ